jgi:hypothetical protein
VGANLVRLTSFVLFLAAATAVSTAAFADPEPPTPEQIAVASAKVDRLIAAGGAQDEFGNLTASLFPLAVHRASGMRCGFQTLREARLDVIAADADHGSGGRCTMMIEGYRITTEVVRASTPATVDALAEAVLAADRARRPELAVLAMDPKIDTVAPIRLLSYRYGAGQADLAQVAVSVVGPWRLTLRLEDSYARRGFDTDAAEKVLLLQLVTQLDLIAKHAAS